MLTVEVFAKKVCSPVCGFFTSAQDCCLCGQVREVISKVGLDVPFSLKEVDISVSEELQRAYASDIPLVLINGKKAFKFKVDEAELRKRLRKELIRAGMRRLGKKKSDEENPPPAHKS